jgi:hypothetical protein
LFGFGEKRGAAVEGPRGGEGWGEVGGLRRKRGDAEGICRGRWARRIMEDWRMAGKEKAGDGVGL